MIACSAKNLLKRLRDGDWKPQSQKPKKPKRKEPFAEGWGEEEQEEMKDETEGDNTDSEEPPDDHEHDDLRVEGTTAYLPPEVVMGAVPTPAADSWAFGCVLYQCLSGRPPILEDDDDMTRHRIVTFEGREAATHQLTEGGDPLFRESHASKIDSNARTLIRGALSRNVTERIDMGQIANHDFFVASGTDVFSLYRQPAHPLDVGDVSPVADAQWSRRQFSSIWAPQPQAYDINLNSEAMSGKNLRLRGSMSNGPIPEGDEAGSFFLRSVNQSGGGHHVPLPTGLRHISEKTPLTQQ